MKHISEINPTAGFPQHVRERIASEVAKIDTRRSRPMTLKEKQEVEMERLISRIIIATASVTGAGVDEIDDAKTRRRKVDVEGRVVAMMAVVRLAGLSHAETAKRFRYAEHSTVSYMLRRFNADPAIVAKVDVVCDMANVSDSLFSKAGAA